ncbi:MAG: hypothetical protein NWS20_01375 [Rickettsiaceae bacterium]|nr:hypothetical protein [Rickettsiaceae bacterium]
MLFADQESVLQDYTLPFETDGLMPLEIVKEIDLNIQRDFAACDIDKIIAYTQHPKISEHDKYAANLFVAAGMQNNVEYTKLMMSLIQTGYSINHIDSEGMTSIQRVAGLNDNNGIMLGLLLELDADVNELGNDGFNAVHNAIKVGNYATLDKLLAAGGDVNLIAKNGDLPMTMVMQSRCNMKEMFYVMVKHGASLKSYDLEALEEMAGVSIDPQSLDFVKSALYVDSMLGLIEEKFPLIDGFDQNIAGARLAFYINKTIAQLGVDNELVVKMQQLLSTTFPGWEMEEIEQPAALGKSINWRAIIELNAGLLESVIGDYLAGRTPVIPEKVSVDAPEGKDDAVDAIIIEQPKKQSLFSIKDLQKLLVIIKKGLSIEAVKVEFAEQEDLFVKMYNSFTKIENAESLLQLYELNHTEEMITAELSGDIVVESL